MNWEKRDLIGREPLQGSFKNLVDREIRQRRRDERRLAEQRTTKHQLQTRKSCVVDARSYRIVRGLPLAAAARFEWKTLIPLEQLNKVGSACLKKFGDYQLKRWLHREIGSPRNVLPFLRRLTR